MSKKPQAETSKGQEKDQEKQEAVPEKKDEKPPQKVNTGVFCQHCANRNNTESDKRGPSETGGSGWCSAKSIYVKRKNPAEKCDAFKKRDKKASKAQDQQTVEIEEKAPDPNALCKMCKQLAEKDGETSSGYCNAKNSFVGGLSIPLFCEHYTGGKPKYVIEREKYAAEKAAAAKKAEERQKRSAKNEEVDQQTHDRDAVEEKVNG